MSVVFEDGCMVVSIGRRRAEVPFAMEGDTMVVDLDDLDTWSEPAGEAIGIEQLAAIAEQIEAACEAAGIQVEFN